RRVYRPGRNRPAGGPGGGIPGGTGHGPHSGGHHVRRHPWHRRPRAVHPPGRRPRHHLYGRVGHPEPGDGGSPHRGGGTGGSAVAVEAYHLRGHRRGRGAQSAGRGAHGGAVGAVPLHSRTRRGHELVGFRRRPAHRRRVSRPRGRRVGPHHGGTGDAPMTTATEH